MSVSLPFGPKLFLIMCRNVVRKPVENTNLQQIGCLIWPYFITALKIEMATYL